MPSTCQIVIYGLVTGSTEEVTWWAPRRLVAACKPKRRLGDFAIGVVRSSGFRVDVYRCSLGRPSAGSGTFPRGPVPNTKDLEVETVPVSVLAELLASPNDALTPDQVAAELALALNTHGYPTDASSVTSADAVAILEWFDAGIVKPTPEQRAALAKGFRHRRILASEPGAGPSAPIPAPPRPSVAGSDVR